jgi:hypothetical protein
VAGKNLDPWPATGNTTFLNCMLKIPGRSK